MSSPPGSARTEQALLIVFADLTRFTVYARATPAGPLAELLPARGECRRGPRRAAGQVSARRWDSRVVVKAHFGRAVAGPFGQGDRFDVIGSEVSLAATLPARTVSLSAEAFRCLESGERTAYRKHTAPVVYIPVDDPRP